MFGHVSIKVSNELESLQANTTEDVWGVMFSLMFVVRIVHKKCFSTSSARVHIVGVELGCVYN